MYNYLPSQTTSASDPVLDDSELEHFEGNYFNMAPEDLEWPVDLDEEDTNDVDDEADKEVECEGEVAEQEADWEPPVARAEELEMNLNDQHIPMDIEDSDTADLNGECAHLSCCDAELPLHRYHGLYITSFPLSSAGAIIMDTTDLDSDENGYQSTVIS